MAQSPCDIGRKDELITGRRIQMNIYDRQNKVRGKIYSEMLKKRQQKSSTSLYDGVIMKKGCKTKVITMFMNLGPLAKGRHGVKRRSP